MNPRYPVSAARPTRGCRPRSLLLPFVGTLLGVTSGLSPAQTPPGKWVAAWTASPQGPYLFDKNMPAIFPFIFPQPGLGASDQTFRLIVKPDLWATTVRLRFSNLYGNAPVTLESLRVGLQANAATVVTGTTTAITFGRGQSRVTLAPGTETYSDAAVLPFVSAYTPKALEGRRLSVSFHVVGNSGPMTVHYSGATPSFLTGQGGGDSAAKTGDTAFPFATVSYFFLDAVDVFGPANAEVVVALGDSLTDGTNSTLGEDDRWPNALSYRLHARFGDSVSVVNAGIAGNRILTFTPYNPANPFRGGPSVLERFDHDVLGTAGVTKVIWLEGTNDLGGGASLAGIEAGMRQVVARAHAAGLKIYGCTIPSFLGSFGDPQGLVDPTRKALNAFIRTAGLFDGVAEFDATLTDPATGMLRAAYTPGLYDGGGDKIHPNRAGYQDMANHVNPYWFAPAGWQAPP